MSFRPQSLLTDINLTPWRNLCQPGSGIWHVTYEIEATPLDITGSEVNESTMYSGMQCQQARCRIEARNYELTNRPVQFESRFCSATSITFARCRVPKYDQCSIALNARNSAPVPGDDFME